MSLEKVLCESRRSSQGLVVPAAGQRAVTSAVVTSSVPTRHVPGAVVEC